MKTKIYFALALIISLVTVVSCNSNGSSEKDNKKTMVGATVIFSDTGITKLVNSQVCMINNRFMNSEQIAVPLNEKTYYGCCEGCVKALKEDSTTHYIPDPLSGEQVDKAIAFIIGKPGSKEDVFYFKTETNAREYFSKYLQRKR
ncbi:MAG: TRASH domain-containing protein [Bacteroidota bacterium]